MVSLSFKYHRRMKRSLAEVVVLESPKAFLFSFYKTRRDKVLCETFIAAAAAVFDSPPCHRRIALLRCTLLRSGITSLLFRRRESVSITDL